MKIDEFARTTRRNASVLRRSSNKFGKLDSKKLRSLENSQNLIANLNYTDTFFFRCYNRRFVFDDVSAQFIRQVSFSWLKWEYNKIKYCIRHRNKNTKIIFNVFIHCRWLRKVDTVVIDRGETMPLRRTTMTSVQDWKNDFQDYLEFNVEMNQRLMLSWSIYGKNRFEKITIHCDIMLREKTKINLQDFVALRE